MTCAAGSATAISIAGREIGAGCPAYVIAEISANHGQDFDQAVQLIEAAHAAGADAVKLQTYTPDTMTLRSDRECFRIGGGTLWDGKTLYDLYSEAYTPWEWHPKLKEIANRLGMHLFSTPFDASAVDFLESLDVPAHKIASFEIVDIPLIRRVARTGKPIIMSTGMAALEEIEEAVAAARDAGAHEIALLKCTSAYPAPPREMNLRTIADLALRFGVPAGLSDHTIGIAVPVAAVALGAAVVEKHICLSRSVPGPDSQFSLEPHEFREMVAAIRTAEQALGTVHYGVSEREARSAVFRRSLFVTRDVRAGEVFGPENVRAIRPAHGLHPRHLDAVMGQRAAHDITAGTPFSWDLLARVYLRPLGDSDTASVLRWRNTPSVHHQLFAERPPSREEHESFVADLHKREDRREFIIVAAEGDVPVGQIGLSRIDRDRGEAEYGILIGEPDFHGKGIAREASELILRYAFRDLGLRRVILNLFQDNFRAHQLYSRLGFADIPGTGADRIKDGVLRPTVSMSLDRRDWEKRA